MLGSAQRRARPMDLGPASTPAIDAERAAARDRPGSSPIPDGRVLPEPATRPTWRWRATRSGSPSSPRCSTSPPRQRAVLILREVLALVGRARSPSCSTPRVASVNSALQRARATLAATDVGRDRRAKPMDAEQQELLARYVDAFERYDLDSLAALLHEDATLSMPPLELWLRGPADIRGWMLGTGSGCRGSRLIPTAANGTPAFGQYRPRPGGRPRSRGR